MPSLACVLHLLWTMLTPFVARRLPSSLSFLAGLAGLVGVVALAGGCGGPTADVGHSALTPFSVPAPCSNSGAAGAASTPCPSYGSSAAFTPHATTLAPPGAAPATPASAEPATEPGATPPAATPTSK